MYSQVAVKLFEASCRGGAGRIEGSLRDREITTLAHVRDNASRACEALPCTWIANLVETQSTLTYAHARPAS